MTSRLQMSILLIAVWGTLCPAATVDFDTQIIPVLTKAGCNTGSCHGAAAGRGNLHLSLLGADPAADYEAIVHAYNGRRVNLLDVDKSLVLAKPTGGLEHEGDVVFSYDSPEAQRIRDWIGSGAVRLRQRELVSFQIEPSRQVVTVLPANVSVRAVACYDNGESEDVTSWVTFTSPDSEAAHWDADRREMVVQRRGAHAVLARYLDRVVPVELLVPLADAPVDLSEEPRANFIDDWILRLLVRLRLPVSPLSDDAEFLRRAQLDLVGRLPDPARTREFLADRSPDKRERLIDELLANEAFVDYWTLRFARWLNLHSLPNDQAGVETYGQWIHGELAGGSSIQDMARALLLATGDTHVVGPANFTRMAADARAQAEQVGQFFLGARLGCANCHNHPLDHWTQDDYHGLAAIFARLDRGRVVQQLARGAVTNVRTNEPAVPRIPGERDLAVDGDHRVELADWLLSDDQATFARVMVNRVWQTMFGRGLVDPTDDVRATNPCSHPELLEALAQDWITHHYDLRHLLRRIAISDAYQRSGQTNRLNQSDDRFYTHSMSRALPPEVLADAISDLMGVPLRYENQPVHVRAVQLLDPLQPAPTLDLLGRCSRRGECSEALASHLGLTARLHLLNGELINARLIAPQGRLQQLIQSGVGTEAIVTEFYLRAFSRHPSELETTRWAARIDHDDAAERSRRLEDFVWSLLNSESFATNH